MSESVNPAIQLRSEENTIAERRMDARQDGGRRKCYRERKNSACIEETTNDAQTATQQHRRGVLRYLAAPRGTILGVLIHFSDKARDTLLVPNVSDNGACDSNRNEGPTALHVDAKG